MLLLNLKNLLWLRKLERDGVIDLIWIEFVALFLRDKTALVTEPLLCETLSAPVTNFFLTCAAGLLFPVSIHL
jgi:hypothetical protein